MKKLTKSPILFDCTLRDGGYYNNWDFSIDLIKDYIQALYLAKIDFIELGFRFLKNTNFKGVCAFTTDEFISSLNVPKGIGISVMVNGSDLCGEEKLETVLNTLFPNDSTKSPVDLVRIACHYDEINEVLPATSWIKDKGFLVGFNLMQIGSRSNSELIEFGKEAKKWPIDVLYFADSTGSLIPDDIEKIVTNIKINWSGLLGIHAHDNLSLALSNTLRAKENGVTWLDSTVLGMGRGPGNVRTEELLIESVDFRNKKPKIAPLLSLITNYFKPLKDSYNWGSNPYYYLAGKYEIHPTYIQQMLEDESYDETDMLSVIEHLREKGGLKFTNENLKKANLIYSSTPIGTWNPVSRLKKREVLLLGAGPGVFKHKSAIESYIKKTKPVVIALNIQNNISSELIDLRAACHPVRIISDIDIHKKLDQPLIIPYSMLSSDVISELDEKSCLDFGISIDPDDFGFKENYCKIPAPFVFLYALAIAATGEASRITLAGFDGYKSGDIRNDEMEGFIKIFKKKQPEMDIISITETAYKGIKINSVYGL